MSQTARQTKNDRRDAARDKARAQREAQQRRARRRRVLLQGGIAVVILAIVAVVSVVIVTSVRPPSPGPANMADDGALIAGKSLAVARTAGLAAGAKPDQRAPQSGVIAIRTYEDFGCPFCGEFEKTNAAYIKQLVQSGRATLQIYPVAILDRNFQGSKYSTRAANAAAAVAQYSPDSFYAFHTLLYDAQPAEGSTGLTDDRLIAIAKQAGVSNLAAVTSAIRGGTFENWVADAPDRFDAGSFARTDVSSTADYVKLYNSPDVTGIGTPVIFVNGKLYTGSVVDQSAFSAAIAATQSTNGSVPSASPSASTSATPSPSPTE